jgi:hypothetical protein
MNKVEQMKQAARKLWGMINTSFGMESGRRRRLNNARWRLVKRIEAAQRGSL